jgi:NitT/TauT family transport system ATP-binding protein
LRRRDGQERSFAFFVRALAPSGVFWRISFRKDVAMTARIDLEGLVYSFGRHGDAGLGPLDLTITPGERLALLGPSGVGKSTLLNLIAGLAQPQRGRIVIGGAAVNGPSPRATIMFQRPALLPWATLADNVGLGLVFSGAAKRDPAAARRRVASLLDAVGLGERAQARPAELSGGQQQRVALARALAPEPDVLLLDEPFSALDIATRASLRADVARIAQARGTTVILVTHDIADALAVATRAVVLGGRPARIHADMGVGEEGIEHLTQALRAA